jgi:hypothetical protein
LCTDSSSASYSPTGGTVTAGLWAGNPSECGPYAVPAAPATATISMTAVTKAFDPAITSPTGDVWQLSVDPSATPTPVLINAGQTVTVNVTLTPSANSGTVVSGDLYIDDLSGPLAPYGQTSGDELAAIPYEYTVGE